MNIDNFEKLANAVLTKHKDTLLRARWEEATSFGEGAKATAFWIRDSEDVVNIVWLCLDGIRDISQFLPSNVSIFNFLPLSSIITVETREIADATRKIGYDVNGDFIVRVFSTSRQETTLVWSAETEEQKQELRVFLSAVCTTYLNVSR